MQRDATGAVPRRDSPFSVLGCCTLAAVAYAVTVGAIWPGLDMLLPLLAVFLASAVASIAGFAFAPICAVMLVHLVDEPMRIVSIILVASIAMQGYSVLHLWRDLDWRGGVPFLLGGLATLPLGLMLLLQISGRGHILLLGTLLMVFAAWMLWRPPSAPQDAGPRWAQVLVGAAGGVAGGLLAFPAAPVVVWCGVRGLGRGAARGLTQPYILMMQVAALLLLQVMDPRRGALSSADPELLLTVAPALFGTVCGLALFDRLSDQQFGRTLSGMLLVAGGTMVL